MNNYPQVNFKGNRSSATDFTPVRDGRRSRVFYQDIDLSTARSVAANTHLVLNIAGNAFYQDQESSDGKMRVHFQDTNLDNTPAPLTSTPGTIFRVPFTQILIENAAQAGKKARIVYGVDIDFQPNTTSQVTIAGSVAINEIVSGNCQYLYGSQAGANITQLLAPAANVNGATIREAALAVAAGAANTTGSIFASPTSGGYVISAGRANTLQLLVASALAGQLSNVNAPGLNRVIPAGWGIYVSNNGAADTNSQAFVSVDLL